VAKRTPQKCCKWREPVTKGFSPSCRHPRPRLCQDRHTARAGTDGLKNYESDCGGPPKPLRTPLRSSKTRSRSTHRNLADCLSARRMSRSHTFAALSRVAHYGWFGSKEIRRRRGQKQRTFDERQNSMAPGNLEVRVPSSSGRHGDAVPSATPPSTRSPHQQGNAG